MKGASSFAGQAALPACATVPQLWRLRCAEWRERPAIRHKRRGVWRTLTWGDYFDQARGLGLGLRAAGVEPNDVVSVLCDNRPEWLLFDMAAQAMGFVCHGVFPSCGAEEVGAQLLQAGSRVVLVENDDQLHKVLKVRERCPRLGLVIVIEPGAALRGERNAQLTSYAEFLADGLDIEAAHAAEFDASIASGRAGQTACLAFTPGTTEAPKGVPLTQGNLMYQVAWAPRLLGLAPGDASLSVLSLCNMAERVAALAQPLACGHVVHFPENAATLLNDLREVAPQFLMGPPRLWSKLQGTVEAAVGEAIPLARRLYARALDDGSRQVLARLAGPAPGAARSWSQRLVLPNLLRFVGLQRLRMGVVHVAALAVETGDWFAALGIDLRAAYGLTEAGGLCTLGAPGRNAAAEHGRPLPGIELQIGANREVLVRGPGVFGGYWARTPVAGSVVDAQGWLHTGDCGTVGAEGAVVIEDRMGDLLGLRTGQAVSPGRIERLLGRGRHIARAVVLRESEGGVGCLVMLNPDGVLGHARERRIAFADFADLSRHPEIAELIAREIDAVNAQLGPEQRIERFGIVPRSFAAADEELTPTLNLRRAVLGRKYAPLVHRALPGT